MERKLETSSSEISPGGEASVKIEMFLCKEAEETWGHMPVPFSVRYQQHESEVLLLQDLEPHSTHFCFTATPVLLTLLRTLLSPL